MIKKYAYNSKTQLTKNINVSELKCHGAGHKHNIVVDTTHINNVQDFMNINGYTKIIISRGYSCSYYNNCDICPLHKNKYENVNCKMDLCSLASKDNVEIEVLEND